MSELNFIKIQDLMGENEINTHNYSQNLYELDLSRSKDLKKVGLLIKYDIEGDKNDSKEVAQYKSKLFKKRNIINEFLAIKK